MSNKYNNSTSGTAESHISNNVNKRSQGRMDTNKTSLNDPKQIIDQAEDNDYNTEYGDGDIPDIDK